MDFMFGGLRYTVAMALYKLSRGKHFDFSLSQYTKTLAPAKASGEERVIFFISFPLLCWYLAYSYPSAINRSVSLNSLCAAFVIVSLSFTQATSFQPKAISPSSSPPLYLSQISLLLSTHQSFLSLSRCLCFYATPSKPRPFLLPLKSLPVILV